jgi:hypothetical protein
MKELVDKVRYKRAGRMRGHAPHKMFKMAIKNIYLKKKEKEKNLFDIDSVSWKGLQEKE